MRQKILCIALLIMLPLMSVFAQNNLEVTYASIRTEVTDSLVLAAMNNGDDDLIDSLLATANADVSVFAVVADTTIVQDVHLKLGRTLGATDVYNGVFNFQNPNGTTVRRSGDGVYLELGNHGNLATLYLEIWVTDPNGNSSIVYQTSLN